MQALPSILDLCKFGDTAAMVFSTVSASGQPSGHLNVILVFGLIILSGTFGASFFQKVRIPQVIGYVTVGILLGPVLKIVSQQTVQALEPFSLFALGIIAFLIGGELKRDIFLRYGKQVAAILLFEGGSGISAGGSS